MDLNKHAGRIIRALRDRGGVAVEDLASDLGLLSIDSVYRLENGKTSITMRHIQAMASRLGHTPQGLLREISRPSDVGQ